MSAKLKEINFISCMNAAAEKEIESTTNALAKMWVEKKEIESIHTYIKYAHAPKFGEFVLSEEWCLVEERDSENIVTMKNIPTTDSVYRLCYAREPDTQQFTVKLKMDFEPYGHLAHPPVMLKLFSACEMKSSIYVHNNLNDYFGYSDQSPSESDFSAEEVSRGIYAYRCGIDRWKPVPALKTRVLHSILTTDQNRLYALGGRIVDQNTFGGCRFQAYDERTDAWQILDRPNYFYSSRFSDATVFKNHIFALNTDLNFFELYDLTAGKWARYQVNLTPEHRHPCFSCPEKQTSTKGSHDKKNSWNVGNQRDQLFDPKKLVTSFSYGKCRFVQLCDTLYLFSIGTQENLMWEFDEEKRNFFVIGSLNNDPILNPKMKKCSQIYDVVAF